MRDVEERGAVRRLPFLAVLMSAFVLISCHHATTSTAITCTTTAATTSSNSSSSSCTDPVTNITVAISPVTATVTVATTAQFQAGVSGGTNTIVTWQVNGVAGGNDTVGRIDTSGKYIAPTQVPSPANVNVTAVSYEDPALSVSAVTTITAAPTVTVSPTSVTLAAGSANTKTFTGTVTGATDTTVNWLLNGTLGGNATVGTISAAGVYTAPNTPPMGSTVTVTASSNAFPSSVAPATVTISGYSTSSFQGQFAFSMAGKNASGPIFRAGSFIADGNGNLTGGLEDVNAATCAATNPISFVGTYTVSVDGRGTMQFADGCTPATFSFVLVNNNQVQITGFDANGTTTGQANLQDPTSFTVGGLHGTYVFDFSGVHGSAPLSQIGEFNADGLGNITNGLLDKNDGGVPTSLPPFTGSYTVNSNGRGTATLGSLNYSFYMASRGSAKFVETDSQTTIGAAAGAATQQTPNALFSATSLNGNIAFLIAGPAPDGNLATAGSFSAGGNGSIASGVLDENVNGTATQNVPFSNGTYTVAPNGRGTATFTAGTNTYSLVFYLSATGSAVVQEIDSGRTSDGLFLPQQVAALPLGSNDAIQTAGLSATSAQTIAGEIQVSQTPLTISSGNLDINTAGAVLSEAVTGMYSAPAASGRATVTLSPPSPSTDTHAFAVYIVNSTQAFILATDAGRLGSGTISRRF
jgi:hypothetical protein